jgi:hypothetical protein
MHPRVYAEGGGDMTMRKKTEVFASGRIANAYDDVREVWLGDPLGILQRATATTLCGLFGARLHLPVGPLEVGTDIVVDLVDIEHFRAPNERPATKLAFEWCALRSPDLFPIMRASLTIYPVTPAETALELRGTYEPPLGRVGAAADAIGMHHVAKQCADNFLEDLAHLLQRSIAPSGESLSR